jgi:hypothetical protein
LNAGDQNSPRAAQSRPNKKMISDSPFSPTICCVSVRT